jgi:hypothetical protein
LLKKSISFHRQYMAYSGGHQKVCDYIQHTIDSGLLSPTLYLTNSSPVQKRLFNHIHGLEYSPQYSPELADVVFLAGMDWQAYQPFFDPKQIKINLIQGVRHGDKNYRLFQFLQHKAIRLCVSEAVKEAIEPYANGPCFTIKMGHNIPKLSMAKRYDLYILSTKQPQLGQQLFEWASSIGLRVLMHDKATERECVHQAMSESVVVIALPQKVEGFFLPGIEAIALADWAVVPDCIGSREYSESRANISRCELSFHSCQKTIEHALKKVKGLKFLVSKWHGGRLSDNYSLKQERKSYQHILHDLDEIW